MSELDEDVEIDPDLAAAMGFSGFGTQPNKKRRFDSTDGVVDPAVGKAPPASQGANKVPLGRRKPAAKDSSQAFTDAGGTKGVGVGKAPADGASVIPPSIPADSTSSAIDSSKPGLQALHKGVRNEQGDMVYFLPSFLEDPWKDLKPSSR